VKINNKSITKSMSISIYKNDGNMKEGKFLMDSILNGATFKKDQTIDVFMKFLEGGLNLNLQDFKAFVQAGGDLKFYIDEYVQVFTVLGTYLEYMSPELEVVKYFEEQGVSMITDGPDRRYLFNCMLTDSRECNKDIFEFLVKKNIEKGLTPAGMDDISDGETIEKYIERIIRDDDEFSDVEFYREEDMKIRIN